MLSRTNIFLALGALVIVLFFIAVLGAQPLAATGPLCDQFGCYLIHTTANDFVRGEFYATGLRQLGDGEVQLLPVGLSKPWEPTTNLPENRAELALVSYNNILYAIGGLESATYHTEIYSATTSLVGDISTSWVKADDLPAARSGIAAVIAYTPDPVLYVIGGATGTSSESNTIYYKKIGAGGSLSGAWSTATLPGNRVYSAAVARNNNLYVSGGKVSSTEIVYRIPIINTNGDLGAAVNDLDLPERLRALTSVTWQGESTQHVYMLGGIDDLGQGSSDVYYSHFNPDNSINNGGGVSGWNGTSLVDAFNAHGTVQYNGAIFVIGGKQGIASSTAVTKVQTALIDPDGSLHNWGGGVGNWIVTEPLPAPRFFHGTTVNDGGEIFIAGGYNASGQATKTVYHGSTTGSASTYAPVGEYVGEPMDAGVSGKLKAIKWNASVLDTSQMGLDLYYRTSNSLVNLAAANWTLAGTSAQSTNGFTNTLTFPNPLEQRYIQYRAVLTTDIPNESPQLNAVVVDLYTPPTPTPTATSTATEPPSATDTPTGSATPSPTPTLTETPTLTTTPTATPTNTASPTATTTGTATNTPCLGKPAIAVPVSPNNASSIKPLKVPLGWDAATCAQTYKVIVRQDAKKGPKAFKKAKIAETQIKTKKLAAGHTYYWRVKSCNTVGCAKWSVWWKFRITSGGHIVDGGPAEELKE